MSPKLLDNFDYSEISAMIFQDESGDIDMEPSHSCDAELDDEIIGKALSSPLFIQEREAPANLSTSESLLPAQSFFAHTCTGRPEYEPSSDLSQKRKASRDLENEQIRILLRTEIHKHEFQADSDTRSIQELTGIIDSQRREIAQTVASVNNPNEINYFFMNNYQNKSGIFVKLISKVFMRWKNWREFKNYESMNLSRRRLIENQDTINELTARIQELQNEVNCMNDSRDFNDAESVRSGLSHVPSQAALFPPYRDPRGLLSSQICVMRMVYRETFL